jgi:Tfp pilus assembly protein PilO
MRKNRRKILIRMIERVAVTVVLMDALLYFAAVRPLRRLVEVEQQTRDLAQIRLREERSRVERLKEFQAALPGTDGEIKLFVREHVPSRRRAFSRAAQLVRRLTEHSGLQLGSVSYRLSPHGSDPLERLGIEVTLEGPFPGLLSFAHALETGNDFILVHDFAFQPGENGNLALRLMADLYIEP